MQPLDSILLIAEIVLFVILSILAIYLIVSLRKITGSIVKIEKNIDDIQRKADPVLNNALLVSENFKEITTSVKNNIAKIDSVVNSVKERSESLLEFEKKAQDKIEYQIDNTLNLVSAISTGFRTFFSSLKGSKNHKPRKIQIQLTDNDSEP